MKANEWTEIAIKDKIEHLNRYASHVDEIEQIEQVLGGKVSRNVIRYKLIEFTEKFAIDIPNAMKAVVKTFGGDISKLEASRV